MISFRQPKKNKCLEINSNYGNFLDSFFGSCTFWTEGMQVFVALYAFESTQHQSWMYFLVGTVLIYIHWEGGQLNGSENTLLLLTTSLHHMGSVIAFLHQPFESASAARINTIWFAWLWSAHSFGFFQAVVLKLKKDEHSVGMDILRYCYAIVSVFLFHFSMQIG